MSTKEQPCRAITQKEENMKLTIGENIRNFRKKNDLTQETLADRLGVTYQSISRWENGITYPDLELIPAIAEVLAVTVDELLGMPQIEKENVRFKHLTSFAGNA